VRFFSNSQNRVPDASPENSGNFWQEEGIALLIAVIALSVFSLLGLYIGVASTTEVRISENYESHVQADLAARAGLNHARDLIRGLRFNDLLQGPDVDAPPPGTYPSTLSGQYAFRNWVDWSTARSLNMLNPPSDVGGPRHEGLFNTGKVGTTPGTPLIPATGVAFTAPNPYGPGTVITARYFVKVTDNDDGDGDPFTDSDRIIIVRSTGVAQTIRETGGPARANSVAVYEAMYKEYRLFDLDVPFAIQGDMVLPASSNMFNGNSFNIDGNPNRYGIGTIDTNPSNNIYPADEIKKGLSSNQTDQIKGSCCPKTEAAIGEITASLNDDQRLLLDPKFLWNVAYNLMPQFADNVYQGDQKWTGAFTDDLGHYDSSKPVDDPSQSFKVTYVNGDLDITGDVTGAGILFVTGKLSIRGSLKWAGMALVVGGSVDLSGHGAAVEGNLYLANLQPGNPPTFGNPAVTVGGSSTFQTNAALLRMVLRQLPPMEISRREITSSMDP